VPNGLFKNIDNWWLHWRVSNVLSTIINPINFRWSLWVNALFNTADNLWRLWNYIKKYWVNWNTDTLIRAISQDSALMW
jgi:hypothetical protein